MSVYVQANGNKASRQANQAIANQNCNSNSFLCYNKDTAILLLIVTAMIAGIVIGVSVGLMTKGQHEAV